jgi:hypothetical protein
MGIWVGVAVLVVLFAGVLIVRAGGKENRAARRDLRQFRKQSGSRVNHSRIAEHRRDMHLPPVPGSDTFPGGS